MNRDALIVLAAIALCASGCTSSATAATLDTSVEPATIGKASQAAASPAATAMPTAPPPFVIAPTANPNELSTSYEDAASLAMQLAVGTLELDDTDQRITQDQAVALLPLWQEYLNTAAHADGLVDEIELMMTPTQLKAIADLAVTQQSAEDVVAKITLMAGSTGDRAESTRLVATVVAYLEQVADA